MIKVNLLENKLETRKQLLELHVSAMVFGALLGMILVPILSFH